MSPRRGSFLDEFLRLWIAVIVLLAILVVAGWLIGAFLALLVPAAVVALALLLISRLANRSSRR